VRICSLGYNPEILMQPSVFGAKDLPLSSVVQVCMHVDAFASDSYRSYKLMHHKKQERNTQISMFFMTYPTTLLSNMQWQLQSIKMYFIYLSPSLCVCMCVLVCVCLCVYLCRCFFYMDVFRVLVKWQSTGIKIKGDLNLSSFKRKMAEMY